MTINTSGALSPVGLDSTTTWLVASIGVLAAVAVIAVARVTFVELLVVCMPFMFFPPIGITLNMSVADFLLPLTLLATWHRWRSADCRPETRALLVGSAKTFVLFFTVIALSTAWAGLFRDGTEFHLAVVDGMKLVVCALYFLCVAIYLTTASESQYYRALRLWVFAASVQALGSVLGLLPSDGYRSLGYFQDPNLYAGYLLTSIVVAMHLALRSRLRTWPLHLAVLALGVLSTGSRGAVLTAGLLIVATLALVGLTKVGLLLGTISIGVGTVLLTSPEALLRAGLPGAERLTSSAANAGTDPRWALWEQGMVLWRDHPLLGIGLGQYTRFSQGLTPYVGDGVHGQVAHNTFLSFAAEAGTIGLIAFIALLLYPVRTLLRSRPVLASDRALLIGIAVMVGMMLTLNLQNLRYVWVFLALVLAASARRTENVTDQMAQSSRSLTPASTR